MKWKKRKEKKKTNSHSCHLCWEAGQKQHWFGHLCFRSVPLATTLLSFFHSIDTTWNARVSSHHDWVTQAKHHRYSCLTGTLYFSDLKKNQKISAGLGYFSSSNSTEKWVVLKRPQVLRVEVLCSTYATDNKLQNFSTYSHLAWVHIPKAVSRSSDIIYASGLQRDFGEEVLPR